MKQGLKVVAFSSIVGTILAGIFFLSIKNKAEAKEISLVYAYQVGVFKNRDNAENLAKNYKFTKIVKDQEYFRVFIGITNKNKDILNEYWNQTNSYYFIKELQVSDEILEMVKKFDDALINSENKEIIIKGMLESFPDEL